VTSDEGPRSRDQWIQAILLVESFKLVPRPLVEGPRPKSGKLRLNLHGTCFGGKFNWLGPKNSAKRRVPDLENQEWGQGPRYSPTQGFNLLQMSPNWFLGNWILDPCLKWALEYPHWCSVCDPAQIFLTSTFTYLLFSNPIHKIEMGIASMWEPLIANPPGIIIMIGQSKTGCSSQIIFITLFSSRCAALLPICPA